MSPWASGDSLTPSTLNNRVPSWASSVLSATGLGIYNVKDYGAVGDGVTDDTSAISSALAAVLAAGGTLLFPAGDFIVSSGISTSTPCIGVSIKGVGIAHFSTGSVGFGSRVVWGGAHAPTTPMFTFQGGGAHSNIEDIGFYANQGQAPLCHIYWSNVAATLADITHDRVHFSRAAFAGVCLGSTVSASQNASAEVYSNVRFNDCYIARSPVGVYLNATNAYGTHLTNCEYNHETNPSVIANHIWVKAGQHLTVRGGYMSPCLKHEASGSTGSQGWAILFEGGGDVLVDHLYSEHPAILRTTAVNSLLNAVVRGVYASATSSTGSSHDWAVYHGDSGTLTMEGCVFDRRRVFVGSSASYHIADVDLTYGGGTDPRSAVSGWFDLAGSSSSVSGSQFKSLADMMRYELQLSVSSIQGIGGALTISGNISANSDRAYRGADGGNLWLWGASGTNWMMTENTVDAPVTIRTGSDGSMVLTRPVLLRSGTAILPAQGFSSEVSLGLYRSAASTLALSYGTLDLTAAKVSVRTVGASLSSANVGVNELAIFVGGTSGATLALRSGGTIYYFASSASTVG